MILIKSWFFFLFFLFFIFYFYIFYIYDHDQLIMTGVIREGQVLFN